MATLTPVSASSADSKVLSVESADFTTESVTMANDGAIYLIFHNEDGESATDVTFVTPATFDGLDLDDRVETIGADEVVVIGTFNPRLYNDGDGNLVMTTVAAEADLKVMAIRR